MPGPPPEPAALKLLKGRRPGQDSAGRPVAADPGYVRLSPTPPEHLGVIAAKLWRDTVPELMRLKLTKPIDGPSLTAYCETWERFVVATKQVHELGITASTSQGIGVAPWVRVAETSSKELRAWAQEFGLTPSAEQRVSSVATRQGGEDDGQELFAGTG